MSLRFPAEWEAHRATWISWPHEPADFPGKISTIYWVYAEIVRTLSKFEHVEIICHDEKTKELAEDHLLKTGVTENYSLHILPTDRSWLRDSAPTCVIDGEKKSWTSFEFNAWAKYENFHQDRAVPEFI